MLLVPVYFVPVVIVSAIFINKLINHTLVSVVTMSTSLAILQQQQQQLTNYREKDIRDDPSHWGGLETTLAFNKQMFLHQHDHAFFSADLPLLNAQ